MLIRILIRQHIIRALPRTGSHILLARRRNNSTISDHSLDDTCSEFLGVGASFSAVIAMRVYAGPHEKRKVDEETKELAGLRP